MKEKLMRKAEVHLENLTYLIEEFFRSKTSLNGKLSKEAYKTIDEKLEIWIALYFDLSRIYFFTPLSLKDDKCEAWVLDGEIQFVEKKLIEEAKYLIGQCIRASKVTIGDPEKGKELLVTITDIGLMALFANTKNGALKLIYKYYFDTTLTDSLIPDYGTERELKLPRRNAKRGCAEIKKITQLPYSDGISKDRVDAVNEALIDIQSRLPVLFEEYFSIKMEGYGQTKEKKAEIRKNNAEIKHIMERKLIVATVNSLKFIGFSETNSFKVVSTLIKSSPAYLKFSPSYRSISPEAVRERCKRYKNHP